MSKQIKSVESVVVDLPWKSSNDHHLHCGVAMMRYMETYMGLQKWNSGLKKNKVSLSHFMLVVVTYSLSHLKKNNVSLTRKSVIAIFIICFFWNEKFALFRLKFVSSLLIYIHEANTYPILTLNYCFIFSLCRT